eukprot:GFYU01005168.1.p1 GENE.GFYU01005168.1~~GFYU01005168.1.p1  ORF type:complete len:362 (-),score=63.65 GFYU01005168.1:126-1169(-)
MRFFHDVDEKGSPIVPSLLTTCARWFSWHLDLLEEDGLDGMPDHILKLIKYEAKKRKSHVTGEGLPALISLFPSPLLTLDLSWYESLQDDALEVIGRKAPELQELNLSWCADITDEGINHICRGCQELKTLSLKGCVKLSMLDGVETLKDLHTLDLELCHNINDMGIQRIVRRCPKILDLNIGGCKNITNISVQLAAEHLKQLMYVSLAGCPHITDFDLEDVAKNCANLQGISLRACRRVGDEGVKCLTKRGRSLRKQGKGYVDLDLGGMARVTTEPLKALLMTCTDTLERLDLRGNPNYNNYLVAVLESCKQLKYLNLDFCEKIDDATVAGLKSRLPQCEIKHKCV